MMKGMKGIAGALPLALLLVVVLALGAAPAAAQDDAPAPVS